MCVNMRSFLGARLHMQPTGILEQLPSPLSFQRASANGHPRSREPIPATSQPLHSAAKGPRFWKRSSREMHDQSNALHSSGGVYGVG